jgi:hypothetical protein
MTTRLTIWSSGYKVRSISKLEEEEALSRGAELLSEFFIFSVAAGVTTYEYLKSSESSKKKEEAQLQKIRDDATRLQLKLNSLDKRLVALEEYAKANRSSISVLGGKNYVEPTAIIPIDDKDGDGQFIPILKTTEQKQQQQQQHHQKDGKRHNDKTIDDSSSVKKKKSWLWPF